MENNCLYCNLKGHEIEECEAYIKHKEVLANSVHREVQDWNEKHCSCPKCGNSNVKPTTNTTQYIAGEDYEDNINTAVCIMCGWNGYTYELASRVYGEFLERLRVELYTFVMEVNDDNTRADIARSVSTLIAAFIDEDKIRLRNQKFEVFDNIAPEAVDNSSITIFVRIDGEEMVLEEFMKKYLQQ